MTNWRTGSLNRSTDRAGRFERGWGAGRVRPGGFPLALAGVERDNQGNTKKEEGEERAGFFQ